MALSNTNYEAHAKSGNISENWLFQLFNQDSYLEFDGANDYVDCGLTTSASATSVTDQVSMAFWVNFPALGTNEFIFANNSNESTYGGVWISKLADEKIMIQWGDTTGSGPSDREGYYTSSAVVGAANTWYFICIKTDFEANDATNTLVVAGPEGGSLTSYSSFTRYGSSGDEEPDYLSSNAYLYFGRRGDDANTDYGQFKIRNFGIWSELLDTNNATAIYNSGAYFNFLEDSGNYNKSSSLVGYWEFNNGDSNVRDLKGTLSGTVSGAKYGGFLPIALNNTTVDDVFYHGVITSKNIAIRESINLITSTASSNNIGLDIANFQYQGDDFSAELLLGSNTYLNKGVRVFSQLNGDPDIADCEQIFHGRLTDISHSIDNIKLTVSSQRPWDKIKFPQTKHSKYNIYEPVAYGSFNYSDATNGATNDAAFGGLFPVPVIYTNRNTITTILPQSYSSGTHCYIHHYVGYDWFCSIKNESVSISDATITEGGVNILETPTTHRATGWIRTNNAGYDASDTGGSVTYLTNPQYALDFNTTTGAADTNTYATGDINAATDNRYLVVQTPNKQFAITIITGVKIKQSILWDGVGAGPSSDPQEYDIDFFSNEFDSSADDLVSTPVTDQFTNSIATNTYTFDAQPANAVASESALVCPDELLIKFNPEHTPTLYDHEDHELRVYDIQMRYENRFNYNDNDRKRLADLKYFYCGAAGLTASWDSGAIAHGHDAHRDLLVRFAGQDSADPENWSALNTDRTRNTANDADIDNWKIRYWQLEPTSLKEALEKLQYEFGFVSKYTADGKLKYIYVKQSSELSADHTLTKSDTANLQISNSSLSDVVTKMDISNNLNPAESNRYYSVTTSKNITARTKYNFSSKENIMSVNLDANIGVINTTPQTDVNTDFYSYYDNIVGDVKKIISCDVVNPAKGFIMETGDIVTMSDMGVDPGGHAWNKSGSQYYMITDLNRSVGKVSITLREVG